MSAHGAERPQVVLLGNKGGPRRYSAVTRRGSREGASDRTPSIRCLSREPPREAVRWTSDAPRLDGKRCSAATYRRGGSGMMLGA